MLDTHKFVYCNNNASNISVNVIHYRFISLSHIHHTCIHFLSRSFSNTQSRTKTFSFFVCICFHLFIILHFNSRVANCWAHTSMTMKIIIHLSFHRGHANLLEKRSYFCPMRCFRLIAICAALCWWDWPFCTACVSGDHMWARMPYVFITHADRGYAQCARMYNVCVFECVFILY